MIYPVTIAPPDWRPIIRAELMRYRISQRDFLSDGRRWYMTAARRSVFRRIRDELGVPPYRIARELGFNHTSVYHALGMLPSKRKAA